MKYTPQSVDITSSEDPSAIMDKNFEHLKACDTEAKEKGKMVGRYIQEPFADGYAYYGIVSQNKNSVVIEHLTGLGDDWVIPYWGEKTTIDMDYTRENLRRRDALDALFSKKAVDDQSAPKP